MASADIPRMVHLMWNSRVARAATGGALVVDGLVGVDVPGGRKRAGIVGALITVIIGIAFVAVGWWLHGQHQPYPGGVSATATVTRVVTHKDNDGRKLYSAVLGFTAQDGRQVEVTESESSSSRPVPGSARTVSYLPQDPEDARVIPGTDWVAYLVIGVGLLAALLGAVVFVVRLVTLIGGLVLLSRAARG